MSQIALFDGFDRGLLGHRGWPRLSLPSWLVAELSAVVQDRSHHEQVRAVNAAALAVEHGRAKDPRNIRVALESFQRLGQLVELLIVDTVHAGKAEVQETARRGP